MMQLKFIRLCDHLLYLLLVSSTLFFITFIQSITYAEIVNGSGMSYWDDRTSKQEACGNALNEAKNDALRKLGLESLKSNQVETCSDTGDKVNCQIYQTTFNNISGGYIKDFEIISKGRSKENQKFCEVKIIADAIKFKGSHDPKFVVDASVGSYKKLGNDKYRFVEKNNIYFEGENLVIKGNLSKKAFINILAWYPSIDEQNYYRLFPNKFEKETLFNNLFFIPTKEAYKNYALDITFPKNFKKRESQEYIIILATKEEFAILEKTKVSELLLRLDELGKFNWYMKNIGYSIIKEK